MGTNVGIFRRVRGRMKWLLRDEFTTALAAGSVNGTACEPGPGIRTVVDSGNYISITGEKAVFNGGKSGWGDGLWLPSVTRNPGLACFIRLSGTDHINSKWMVGWDTNAAGYTDAHAFYYDSTDGLKVWETVSGLNLILGITLANNTDYNLLILLRATGAHWYIKGGAFTYWTLCYISDTNSTASLRTAITNWGGQVLSANFARDPILSIIPPPIASTGFNPLGSVDSTLVPRTPFSYTLQTRLVGNRSVGAGYTRIDGIQKGHHYRLRQGGTISKFKFSCVNTTNVTEMYLNVWRRNGGGTYDLVGTSENILSQLVPNTIYTVTLATPITGTLEGDYYGYTVVMTGAIDLFYGNNEAGKLINYTVLDGVPGAAGYDWEAETANDGQCIPFELYATAPLFVFCGDSLMSGFGSVNRSFCESISDADDITYTNISTTIGYKLSQIFNCAYQNLAVGGTAITNDISTNFPQYAIGSKAKYAVIEGGTNDITSGTVTQAQFIAAYTTILDACAAAGAIPIIILIQPRTAANATWMATRDAWNIALTALVATYPTAILIDTGPTIGQFRAGGPAGNLWDLQAAYDADGTHLTEAGNAAVAGAIHAQLALAHQMDGKGHAEGVTGGIGSGGSGLAWTDSLGTWKVAAGSASSSVLDASGISIVTTEINRADVYYSCVLSHSAGSAGVVVRYKDAANYVYIINDGTNVKLFEVTTAVPYPGTQRGTAVQAPVVGARLIVDVFGAAVRVCYNETLMFAYATLTDTTATKIGLITSNINNAFDNIAVFAKGTGNEYSVFDRYVRAA